MKKRVLARRGICAVALMAMMTVTGWAQESEWESQKQITGYIAAEAEYFSNLENVERDYGMILSEVGILASYQSTPNLTIKGVFVYRPGLTIDQMLNEASAQYKANEHLNINVGRFLTPLSPMNTYYYAPVNNSATLPMIISHHEFFPLNMDAISLNGNIGETWNFDYNLFAGGYQNSLWLKTGALGIFGTEDEYFGGDAATYIDPNTINASYSFGSGAHLGVKWQDYLTIGVNTLLSAPGDVTVSYPMNGTLTEIPLTVDRFAYGLNIKAKYKTLQLLSELWQSDLQYENSAIGFKESTLLKGYFVELSNAFGKLTPYARYEFHDGMDLKYDRYTAGVNYRPSFETCLKFEYVYYTHPDESNIGGADEPDLSGIVATVVYSF